MADLVFGPELPPEMKAARAKNDPATPNHVAIHSPGPQPESESDFLYPNDGIWRPSKGTFKEAPTRLPYSQGGSPFQLFSRVKDGRTEMAVNVDPQYLQDTGMTVEEATAGPMRRFNELVGVNADCGPEEYTGVVDQLLQSSPASDGTAMDGQAQFARGMAAFINRAGDMKGDLIKSWEEMLKEGELLESHQDVDKMIRERLEKNG